MQGFVCSSTQFALYNFEKIVKTLKNNEQQKNKLFEDISEKTVAVYQKLIEISVLYYVQHTCKDKIITVRYENLLATVQHDCASLCKLVFTYWPEMMKDKKLHWKVKLKKSSQIIIAGTVIYFWAKEYYQNLDKSKKRNA